MLPFLGVYESVPLGISLPSPLPHDHFEEIGVDVLHMILGLVSDDPFTIFALLGVNHFLHRFVRENLAALHLPEPPRPGVPCCSPIVTIFNRAQRIPFDEARWVKFARAMGTFTHLRSLKINAASPMGYALASLPPLPTLRTLEVRWWSDERAEFHLTNERDSSCIDPWNGHFAAHKGFAVPRQAWLKVGLLCPHLTELRVDLPLGKPNLVVDLMCAFPSLVILSVHIRLVFNHPDGWFACPLYPDGMPAANTQWKATDKDNTIPRLRVLLYNRSVAKRLPEHLQIMEVLTSCCDVVHYRRCCKYQTPGGRSHVSAAGFLACCLDVFPSLKTILTDAPLAAIDSDAYPSLYTLDDRARAQLSRIQSCGLVKHPSVEAARMYTIVGEALPPWKATSYLCRKHARSESHHTTRPPPYDGSDSEPDDV